MRLRAKVVGRQARICPRFRIVLSKAEFAAGRIPDISEIPEIENTISWFSEKTCATREA